MLKMFRPIAARELRKVLVLAPSLHGCYRTQVRFCFSAVCDFCFFLGDRL